jgi:microcin C transport system substrate-binding protein
MKTSVMNNLAFKSLSPTLTLPLTGGGKNTALLIFLFFFLFLSTAHAAPQYGIAMHGDLKYPAGFKNFDYVNPNAPKGGTLRLATLGGFDSLNPFILKGNTAPGLNAMGQGLIYESLMVQADDEPFSMYGLIAQTIDVAPDRSRVTFTLNPAAIWHDGNPITADDVAWTFNTLMTHGAPFFKAYFGDVARVAVDAPRTVTFHIKNKNNRELPLVLAQMVVLPRHYWERPVAPAQAGAHHDEDHSIGAMDPSLRGDDMALRDFSKSTLVPPLGSGPYKIGQIKPGTSIEYVRADNWWARDLNVNRGRYNFDRITFDVYRDHNVALEAFFAGNYDVRMENVAKLWATGYTAPAIKDGRIARAEIENATPQGMQAFIFNTRRPVFADARVRQALALTFDFEWANKKLADSAYTRTDSFFENSNLASSGLPTGRELKILEEYRGKIPDAVFTTPYAPPTTDGSGNNRANLKRAAELLESAGFALGPDGVRINKNGTRLTFEFIESNPALERWVQPFIQNLKKIGVTATLRIIDPTQYQNRMQNFDFDMTTSVMGQSDSPGNEQRDYWLSQKADEIGSRNLIGVRDPVVDELVNRLIAAQTREELMATTRALDRILLHGSYVIPNWHYPKWRVAWWHGFMRPDVKNTKSLGVMDDWWYAPPKTRINNL